MALRVKAPRVPGEIVKSQNIVIVDSEDPEVTKSGTWTQVTDKDATDLTYIYSETTGDYLSFPFEGTGLWLRFFLDSDCGEVNISIDGGAAKTLDFYSSKRRAHVSFLASNLSPGAIHTVKLEVKGTKNAASSGYKVEIDAFLIELSRGALQIWAMIETAIETVTTLPYYNDLIPDQDLVRAMGDATHRWLLAYIKYMYMDLLPDTDNSRNVGSATLRWKDLHLRGKVYLTGISQATL